MNHVLCVCLWRAIKWLMGQEERCSDLKCRLGIRCVIAGWNGLQQLLMRLGKKRGVFLTESLSCRICVSHNKQSGRQTQTVNWGVSSVFNRARSASKPAVAAVGADDIMLMYTQMWQYKFWLQPHLRLVSYIIRAASQWCVSKSSYLFAQGRGH